MSSVSRQKIASQVILLHQFCVKSVFRSKPLKIASCPPFPAKKSLLKSLPLVLCSNPSQKNRFLSNPVAAHSSQQARITVRVQCTLLRPEHCKPRSSVRSNKMRCNLTCMGQYDYYLLHNRHLQPTSITQTHHVTFIIFTVLYCPLFPRMCMHALLDVHAHAMSTNHSNIHKPTVSSRTPATLGLAA